MDPLLTAAALCDQEGAIGFHGKIMKTDEIVIYGEKKYAIFKFTFRGSEPF